jgi:hypothetical protein
MYPSTKLNGVSSQKVLDLRITTVLTSNLIHIYAIEEVSLITKRDSKFVRLFIKHSAGHRRTVSLILNFGTRHYPHFPAALPLAKQIPVPAGQEGEAVRKLWRN